MKICYVSFTLNNPRDQITLRGLRENGVVTKELSCEEAGLKKYLKLIREFRACEEEYDLIMVGYASSVLVSVLRPFTHKRIIYNTLATFYDSMVVSRGKSLILYWLIDALAFSLADKVFLECQTQKDLVTKVFMVNPNKISVHFVGTDDTEFYFDPTIPKLNNFTVVFRGMFLPEAGTDVVIMAAKELENTGINFRIIGRGLLLEEIKKLINELKPKNLELITARLPIEDLRQKMAECHLSLGQMANHPRVHTTIPHKVFESIAMKLPYLTGKNRGVMEIVREDDTCFAISPGDYKALANKIIELRNNSERLNKVTERAYQLYQQEFTPEILAKKIMLHSISNCNTSTL